jgi:hypothetical protein
VDIDRETLALFSIIFQQAAFWKGFLKTAC